MSREMPLKKHLTTEELEQKVREVEDTRLQERLIFIKIMYEGDDRKTAAKKVGRCPATGYNWLKQWNQNGVQGLKPNFDGGPKPKLTQQQKQELKKS